MARRSARFLFGALLAAAFAGCAAPAVRFEVAPLAQLEEKLGGCACGDLLPGAGDEVAVVAESGRLRILQREGDGWRVHEVGRTSGESIQVAVGDLWPGEGEELVAVGMAAGRESDGGPGAVFVSGFDRSRGEFRTVPVWQDTALLHAVAVAELDGDHPGAEVLVGGFSSRLTLLRFRADGSAAAEAVGETPAPAKGMVAHRGGVAIACLDGSLCFLEPGPAGFTVRVLHRAPVGLARLASDGESLLAAADDGSLLLVRGEVAESVHRESLKLRGAVWSDLDPASPGLEAATAGYGGAITLLRAVRNQGFVAEPLFRGGEPLHHLCAGDVDPAPGEELVAVGLAGQVWLVRRRP
jgi:hypothetical protein